MPTDPSDLELVEAHFRSHGGEHRFWIDWVHGDLDEEDRDWFRRHAEGLGLAADVAEVDSPSAPGEVKNALETSTILAEGELVPTSLTLGALGKNPKEVRQTFHARLHHILSRSGLEVPSGGGQQVEYTTLIDFCAGRDSVGRFRELVQWLKGFRARLADPEGPTGLEDALDWLCPALAARTANRKRYTHNPSYRLYARSRLLQYFREKGYVTDESRLRQAAERLDPYQMSQVLSGVADAYDDYRDPLLDVTTREPRTVAMGV
jgi:hypothetical protein